MFNTRFAQSFVVIVGIALAAMLTVASGCNDSNEMSTSPKIECNTDEDCPLGMFCRNGRCLTENEFPCNNDLDCPLGMVCGEGGFCVPAGGQTDADVDKEVDIDATDTPLTDVEPDQPPDFSFLCEPCSTSDDCPGANNYCLEDNSGNKYCLVHCNNTAECPSGYICRRFEFGNQCFPQDGFCEETCFETGCPDGQACNPQTGQCETVGSGTQGFCDPCNSDADCAEGGKCIPDSTGNTYCGIDCVDSPCEIPNTYCKYISEGVKQCWPVSNMCTPGCDCDNVQCPPRTVCNPADCTCQPGPDHCANTGCPQGQRCDYQTGECVQDQPTQNCCNTPGLCEQMGMVCDYQTCQCVQPAGSCQNNYQCGPGEICNISQQCQQVYCQPCSSSFDCGFTYSLLDDVACINGGCAPSCWSDSDCPAGARCQSGDWYSYCVPVSGSCQGGVDGDEDLDDVVVEQEPELEDNCGGITYDGECRGNVLYWCDNGVLKQQDCSESNAVCALWSEAEGGDGGYWCRGVEGGRCGGDYPACMPEYQCVDGTCQSTNPDGDTDVIDSTEPEADESVAENDTVQETEQDETGGQGGLGDPCPNGFATDCDPTLTDACLENSQTGESFCSKACSTDTDCAEATGWCCRAISGGDQYCVPPQYCSAQHQGTCDDPIPIQSLPFSDTGSISGSGTFDGSLCDGISWSASGPEKIYKVHLQSGQTVHISATSSDFDVVLFIADACRDYDFQTCLGQDEYGTGYEEALTVDVNDTGDYYIIVDSWGYSVSGSYTLEVSLQ